MNRGAGVIIGWAILLSGCAHEKAGSGPSGRLPASSASNTSVLTSPSAETPQKVSLPYVFTRHGVEIRVVSVEFSQDQAFFLVNATLQEKRGQAARLSPNFLEARLSGGQKLEYVQYGLGNKISQENSISIDPNAEISISLFYRLPAANAAPIELHFPTGRWWSSESSN